MFRSGVSRREWDKRAIGGKGYTVFEYSSQNAVTLRIWHLFSSSSVTTIYKEYVMRQVVCGRWNSDNEADHFLESQADRELREALERKAVWSGTVRQYLGNSEFCPLRTWAYCFTKGLQRLHQMLIGNELSKTNFSATSWQSNMKKIYRENVLESFHCCLWNYHGTV